MNNAFRRLMYLIFHLKFCLNNKIYFALRVLGRGHPLKACLPVIDRGVKIHIPCDLIRFPLFPFDYVKFFLILITQCLM